MLLLTRYLLKLKPLVRWCPPTVCLESSVEKLTKWFPYAPVDLLPDSKLTGIIHNALYVNTNLNT